MKLIFIFIISFFQFTNVYAPNNFDTQKYILETKNKHDQLVIKQFKLLAAVAKLLDNKIPDEALQSIEKLNSYAQSNWLRKPNQEIKDIDKQNMQTYTKEEQAEIKKMLTQLGFIESTEPTMAKPNMIIILGAQVSRMRERIAYALDLINRKNWHDCKIILLTGDRPLFEDVETDQVLFDSKYITNAKWKKTQPKNESEAALMLWAQVSTKPIKLLATPMQNVNPESAATRRPITNDTIKTLMDSFDAGKYNIIFISNNPYIPYQNETIKAFLLEGINENKFIIAETAGGKADDFIKLNPLSIKDTLARYIYSIITTQQMIAKLLEQHKKEIANDHENVYANKLNQMK